MFICESNLNCAYVDEFVILTLSCLPPRWLCIVIELFDSSNGHLCTRAKKRIIQYFCSASEFLGKKFYCSSGESCAWAVSLYVSHCLYSYYSSSELCTWAAFEEKKNKVFLGFKPFRILEGKKKQSIFYWRLFYMSFLGI